MNLDEIKAKALNEVIQKEISQDSFDDKKTIIKLIAALELAIKQRNSFIYDEWTAEKIPVIIERENKEIDELLK